MKHSINYRILTQEELNKAESLFQKSRGKLLEYASQILWWNKRINLVSRDVSHETLMQHIKHSLILGVIDEVSESESIIDTGSGGGMPGIPLAFSFPEKRIIINDIVSKKMMAVKQMARKAGLKNVDTFTGSIEKYELNASEVIVSKHAFKIDELLQYLGGKSWEKIVFLKGVDEVKNEIKGIELPLKIEIIELDDTFNDGFYDGKGVVIVERRSE
jgi:16S rRNA (guanine527-N7)-methyltransferase